MNKHTKKQIKATAKTQKKEAKAKSKTGISSQISKPTSTIVKLAEGVKGILSIVLAISLIFAVILGQTGVIITLEDIITNLFVAQAGKVVLIVIALALLIYGVKELRIIK